MAIDGYVILMFWGVGILLHQAKPPPLLGKYPK
jgi:hypothetical protein